MMQVRKYRAPSVADALRQIRAELGPDAILLESRKARQPGIRGWFGPSMLEVSAMAGHMWPAGTAEVAPMPAEPERNGQKATLLAPAQTSEADRLTALLHELQESLSHLDGLRSDLSRMLHGTDVDQLLRSQGLVFGGTDGTATHTASNGSGPEERYVVEVGLRSPGETPISWAKQVRDWRSKLGMTQAEFARLFKYETSTVVRWESETSRQRRVPHPATQAYIREKVDQELGHLSQDQRVPMRRFLLERGVDTALLQRTLEAVGRLEAVDGLGAPSLYGALRRWVRQAIRTTGALPTAQDPNVVFLVGPAGAGRTSAVGRLAQFHSRERKVAVVSMGQEPVGDHRLAQVSLAGADFQSCPSLAELARFLVLERANYEAIFIDTPNISLDNQAQVLELKAMLQLAPQRLVLLVVPAAEAATSVERMAVGLGGDTLGGLVFTRLDEAERPGEMLNAALSTGLPIAYLVSGRDLDGGIEVATDTRLAQLLFQTDDSLSPTAA